MTPTGPSAATSPGLPGDIGGGGVSRPSATFPSRTDELDFRQQLEAKYATGLRRSAGTTAVDVEGDAIWISEYLRYRVDGCDHPTAIQRVFAQVDGGAPGPVCGTSPTGAIAFPPRNETFDFRQQLETKYQGMGRSSSSAVDVEGSATWMQEYLRYRTNACDHAASVSNTLTQVDGNPAPATCYVPPAACSFRVWPGLKVDVAAAGASSSVELVMDSGTACTWTATSNASWITLTGGTTGGDRNTQAFTAARNTGGPRSGYITFNWTGGSTRVEVIQPSSPFNLSFSLFDYSRSSSATTECQVRQNPHTCTLSSVTTALPGAPTVYDWRVEYTYNGAQVKTQATSSSTFAFTQACGGSDSNGLVVDLAVTLTVTDAAGNTATVYAGQGFQSALSLRIFPCP